MTPTLDDLLKDADEEDILDNNVQAPSPAVLEMLAKEPATMLWCLRLVQRSSAHCWVKKWARAMKVAMAVAFGAMLVVQAGGWLLARSKLHDEVRAAVTEVLKEQKVIGEDARANRAAVAFTTEGRSP